MTTISSGSNIFPFFSFSEHINYICGKPYNQDWNTILVDLCTKKAVKNRIAHCQFFTLQIGISHVLLIAAKRKTCLLFNFLSRVEYVKKTITLSLSSCYLVSSNTCGIFKTVDNSKIHITVFYQCLSVGLTVPKKINNRRGQIMDK